MGTLPWPQATQSHPLNTAQRRATKFVMRQWAPENPPSWPWVSWGKGKAALARWKPSAPTVWIFLQLSPLSKAFQDTPQGPLLNLFTHNPNANPLVFPLPSSCDLLGPRDPLSRSCGNHVPWGRCCVTHHLCLVFPWVTQTGPLVPHDQASSLPQGSKTRQELLQERRMCGLPFSPCRSFST